MKAYKAYCLDVDGTIYRGEQSIEHAADFVRRLQDKGIEPFYVTNNASKTQAQLCERLANFGITADPECILSSAITAAKYIHRWYAGKSVYFIGTDAMGEALRAEGISCVERNADIVVTGLDWGISYDKLAQACLDIRNGATFLSTNRDVAFPSERGFLPGNGAFTALISTSTGVDPIFIGKPESHMLEAIRHEHGFRKDEMVMVGDNYDTDILAGIRFGIDTIHVNTGVSRMEDVLTKDVPPTWTIENLEEWEVI
ncbi:TIGR01457 family HAD-type hydrolase [Planomicrobium sp. YIM 101495]|uniref:TIGR01457 family HAD-type hydrolase n=1 Tax=Planomicrobium sp. YIM 101495 TaxID=2665160 RepID=UPI0012B9150F|nr:TIGR01457 family HAD-type hydrolase [Planomicrobium sp. YIM 101495]MTD31792.1 TIGR01457 family HAD-type hydrolase [Planomicrobium sp. YIM 101495]